MEVKLELKEESADVHLEEAHASTRHDAEISSNSYDAAFKLRSIDPAEQEGNRAAERKLGVNETAVWRWRRKTAA